MVTAIQRKNLLQMLVMLFALIGMSLSVIGEASSHGVAELAAPTTLDHESHPHSHDNGSEDSENHLHHDTGNHTHETVGHLSNRLLANQSMSLRQIISFAADSPRSFRYRLDRPPKDSTTF
ncbi:hypothetical protein EDB94_2829 [Marinobacter sp. 3-2]|jgi:hypothetical protein|uniref:hypothetical protein n=1 Tax=Marinobacter sp. 3-2 TaxID=2485141 RepID=UPI000D3D6CB9|nr:hypothetical protein [Marinobacter sp. 3-2]ROQ43373.1 hypothetical protein EDB94_2829 [Marinobacter sp. 3-2]